MGDLLAPLVVVVISADVEWRTVRARFPDVTCHRSPFGEWFMTSVPSPGGQSPVLFFQGGWGKISAAASAQYVIDHWSPRLLVNLGTCGGIDGRIDRGTVVLVDRTVVYDIVEQMGDYDEHIAHYTSRLDLSWLREPYPMPVLRSLLVSGDRDLVPDQVGHLVDEFGAVAGDWESGAIAWVASRNQQPCLILRVVTDLVGGEGGEAYGNMDVFVGNTNRYLGPLVDALPAWLERATLLQ